MFLIDLNEIIWGIRNSVLTPMPFLKDFYPMKGVVTNAETKMKSLRGFYLKTIKEHQARNRSSFFVGHDLACHYLFTDAKNSLHTHFSCDNPF